MLRSLYTGESGLLNHQTRMDTIGNNISNVNTTGFKSGRTTFAEMFSQTLKGATGSDGNIGGTNPIQIGLGTSLASIDTIFTNGSVQPTGKNTDMALSGPGLFVVKKDGQEYYTRNGDFEFDKDGSLVIAGTGYKVQGWMGSGGVVSAGGAGTDIVVTVDPENPEMPAQPTTKAEYSLNLDASSKVGTAVYTSVNAYDAEGNVHSVPVYLTKDDVNQWVASVGSLDETDAAITGMDMSPVTVKFTSAGAYDKTSETEGSLTVTYQDGTTQTIALNFSALTQYAGSNLVTVKTDGYAEGDLQSISADNGGNLIGTYTNGQMQTLAQVAVATFPNASGLTKVGTSLYQKSNNSGDAKLDSAEKSGSTITPSALEMSNVSIADEFSDMIVTQRGFQANSKIITVSDEIISTAINMKR